MRQGFLTIVVLSALAAPALAEAPYDAFAETIAPCFDAAQSDAAREACFGTAIAACTAGAEDGGTTFGMMQCALSENAAWDALLNREYTTARDFAQASDQQDEGERAETLRQAQRAWIAFRDANCAMEYAYWGQGSMRLTAEASCLNRMTFERVLDLFAYGHPDRRG